MSKLCGWNRIYLFYGLIFFLLGFTACFLNETFSWQMLTGRFQTFTADLGPYAGWKMPSDYPDIAVVARPRMAAVRFLYPQRLLTGSLAPIISQCHKELKQQGVQLEFQMVTADLDAVFRHLVMEYPKEIIIGLNIKQLSTGRLGRQIDLKLGWAGSGPDPLLERATAILHDRRLLKLHLHRQQVDWLEVSWEEQGTGASAVPAVVGPLMEVLQTRVSEYPSPRQL